MFIADLFAAVVFGVVIVTLLSLAFSTKGPWGSLLWFFMVVALFAWVAGVWLRPYTPVWMGVSWMPIILIGFLVAVILTVISPKKPRNRPATKEEMIMANEKKTAIDAFFWILIVILLLLATSHYYWYPQIGWN